MERDNRDREAARFAGLHVHGMQGAKGDARRTSFEKAGYSGENGAEQLAYEVRTSPDTVCFRNHKGWEVYGNDRLNALHMSNEDKPRKNSIMINDMPLLPSKRVEDLRLHGPRHEGVIPVREVGGSASLEKYRQEPSRSLESSSRDSTSRHAPDNVSAREQHSEGNNAQSLKKALEHHAKIDNQNTHNKGRSL